MFTAKDDAYILKRDGSRCGPYKAKFAGDTIIVNDQMADIDDGDTVVRLLPNGKEEHKEIYKANFYDTSIGGFGPHFQLKVGPKDTTNYFFSANQHSRRECTDWRS